MGICFHSFYTIFVLETGFCLVASFITSNPNKCPSIIFSKSFLLYAFSHLFIRCFLLFLFVFVYQATSYLTLHGQILNLLDAFNLMMYTQHVYIYIYIQLFIYLEEIYNIKRL